MDADAKLVNDGSRLSKKKRPSSSGEVKEGSALSSPLASVPLSTSKFGGTIKCSDLKVNLSQLTEMCLNKIMPSAGKATVVSTIASTSSENYTQLSWSKYSGSLLFANAAVLWMNFDRRGGGCYDNCFEEVSGSEAKKDPVVTIFS